MSDVAKEVLSMHYGLQAKAPVRFIAKDDPPRELVDEIGLCLSGGGYRAMLFHLGALWRLNELGLLSKLNRISSVSGGSITAGYLAIRWNDLKFGQDGIAANFTESVSPVQLPRPHRIHPSSRPLFSSLTTTFPDESARDGFKRFRVPFQGGPGGWGRLR
jgi:hypothetical protein